MATNSTPTSTDTQEVELFGPLPETEFYGYYRKDWIDLCDDLSHSDRTVYGVARSLVFEQRQRGTRNDVVARVSLDILCSLVPGVNGKRMSRSALRNSLRNLSNVGLVSTPEGNPLKVSSRDAAARRILRMRIHDVPCNGYIPKWRNTEEKLAAIQSVVEAGQKSDPPVDNFQAGQKSDPRGQKSDPRGQKSDPELKDDQVKREPYTSTHTPSLSTSPSLDTPEASPSVVVAHPEGGEGISGEETQGTSGPSADAVALSHRLPGPMRQTQRHRMAILIDGLLVAGWSAAVVERDLSTDLGTAQSVYAVMSKRAAEMTQIAPVAEVESPSAVPAPRLPCPSCFRLADVDGTCRMCERDAELEVRHAQRDRQQHREPVTSAIPEQSMKISEDVEDIEARRRDSLASLEALTDGASIEDVIRRSLESVS